MYSIISSAREVPSFTSLFPICIRFISLPSVIALARISSKMLNCSGKSDHAFFVSNYRGKGVSLLPLSMMLAVDFSYMFFTMSKKFTFIPSFLWQLRWACVLFPFILLVSYINIDFLMLNHPFILMINSSWCKIILICYRIHYARILLKTFTWIYMRDTGV